MTKRKQEMQTGNTILFVRLPAANLGNCDRPERSRIFNAMNSPGAKHESERDKGSPTLFYVILGLIVALFVVFLVLKPRGRDAKPPRNSATSLSAPLSFEVKG